MDQRPDSGDQQHETDRQLVDLQAEVDVQATDRYPGEQVLEDGPGVAVPAEHLDQKCQADSERRQRGRAAQQVSPGVGAPTADQQYNALAAGRATSSQIC